MKKVLKNILSIVKTKYSQIIAIFLIISILFMCTQIVPKELKIYFIDVRTGRFMLNCYA